VGRVGLYVPGGLAPLASSVIMNVVPAQAAGVASIAVSSPPQKDFGGLPHPNILALCALLGVDEVYAVGGAQAIAMFAYGVPGLCRKVDLVTGPGNIYVVAAKRLLRGRVGIDSEAGPTEIAVLADDSADPVHVAADLLSQAEHDPMAGSVLVTPSIALADAVDAALEPMAAATRHADRVRTALTGEQSGIVSRPGSRAGHRGGRRLRRRAPRDPDRGRARSRISHPQRGRDLRRAVLAGLPRRLLRRLDARPANRCSGTSLVRPHGRELPTLRTRHRLRS